MQSGEDGQGRVPENRLKIIGASATVCVCVWWWLCGGWGGGGGGGVSWRDRWETGT